MKRLTIKGSMVGSMTETDEALAFAARGLVKPEFEVYPFKQFPEAISKLKNFQVAGRGIIVGSGRENFRSDADRTFLCALQDFNA